MKKILAALLSGILTVSALSGCGTYTTDEFTAGSDSTAASESTASEDASGESQTTSGDGSTFTFIGGNPVTLNPILSQSTDDGNTFYLLQSGLFRYYRDEVYNEICDEYTVSDDGLVYNFHLREANWSDGTPITAEQFAYSIQCALNPEMGSPSASTYENVVGAMAYNSGEGSWDDVGVKVIDDQNLEITLETPDDIFILTLATSGLYPLQQDFVEAQGEKLGSSVDTMQYSGPYVLTEWKLDSSLTFTKNPEYWNADESFPVETVTLLKVDDANTIYSMFEAGEVDAIASVPAQYRDLLADYTTTQSGGDGLMYLWFNAGADETEGDRVMANDNFRLALNYALDRSSIMAAIDPMMQPYSRLMIPVYDGLNGGSYVDEYPIDCPPVEGDVEKAQEYLDLALEELGYSSVEELPEMNFVTWDADRQKLMCEAIIDQWKQNLGITSIQLDQYPIGTAIGMYMSNDYDIFAISLSASLSLEDSLENYVTGGDYNNGIWNCPEYDEIVAQLQTETDEATRFELIQQAEQLLVTGSSIVPFYALTTTYAVQDYVDGFYMPTFGSGFQINELQINK
ncbi:MAG TPA: hypothetical protein IAC43_02565 [Candidatus Faecivivens stercoripullorum]|uniref:Solute-binding protein family 5 domain-containing protein n=1 Tax=Candidatus Faecivivens stercoripullorum TaxID=2840805 RepID=A0A9D1KS26_9FIRM|nr:hypothetical protein [Candidatus Faecivivens stercoripullorum]